MNCFYVEYFKDLRNLESYELGAKMRGVELTDENKKANAGYINAIIREYPKLDNAAVEKLAKILEVSPYWFTCAPCLLSVEDLHYYLKTIPNENDPEGRGSLSNVLMPVKDKDSAICYKFEITDQKLIQALAEYQERKKEFWNGNLTAAEWQQWRFNCLLKSPDFKTTKGRSMRDFIDMFDDLSLTKCAERMAAREDSENNRAYGVMMTRCSKKVKARMRELGHDPETEKELGNTMLLEETDKLKGPDKVTKQNMLRRMRKYYNGVTAPPPRFSLNFCEEFKDYGMTLDLWNCDFYFSGWQDFFNLIVIADIMVCPVVFSNVDGKAFITFDKKIFTSAIAMPLRANVLDTSTSYSSDDDDDDEEEYSYADSYSRSRMSPAYEAGRMNIKPGGAPTGGAARRGGNA